SGSPAGGGVGARAPSLAGGEAEGLAGGGSGLLFHCFRRSREGGVSDGDPGDARPLTASGGRPRRAPARSYHRDPAGYSQAATAGAMRRCGGAGRTRSGVDAVLALDEGTAPLGCQLLESPPGEPARKYMAVLPATDGREGNAQRVGETLLGKTCAMP